ncbi:MFS general substrate transporter [Fomitiporia mediterranea MF3/22]|uniref:MFS general substrate transporter n=1 Tax=Fomitiporia mediterranea (strain MF3/22) TaxID=694068 RepID=UPI0004407826|nr:MFS general substrate transporter [Fomitiporia mediterranea MF3/22]EJD00760.1 MFS general substrate transporter [Fomitiporia mediterranea MF3/22]
MTEASRDHELLKIDPAEERRIVRKLDFCLIPLMTMFYLLSFLDRANIGNARVAGLQKDLKLTDHQYQICVTVLYVPYIAAELPSNLLLRRLGPNLVMPTILTLWGMVCALQGAVKSYAGLVTIRAFLGLIEGPMFPGIVLYLSGFYTRKELSVRIALFFSAASLSGAFSGLLAAAIINMDGMRGRPGWAWIFILEGTFTCLVGLCAFFFTPSTPQDVRFLTQRERDIVTKRLILDRPTTSPLDTFSFWQVWRSWSSPQVILVFIALFMNGTTLYGERLALFLPSIVNQLGFSTTHTQLISVGPFAAGFAVTLISSYLSDRLRKRALFASINAIIAMVGFIVFLRSTSKSMSYGSLFLSVSGTYSLPPLLSAWMANNSEPHYRRATSVAMGFVATNAGGILSTWRYPTKSAPRFTDTTIMNIVFSILILVFSVFNVLYLTWATREKHRRRDELLAPYVNKNDKGAPQDGGDRAWTELGDKHPDFRYAL